MPVVLSKTTAQKYVGEAWVAKSLWLIPQPLEPLPYTFTPIEPAGTTRMTSLYPTDTSSLQTKLIRSGRHGNAKGNGNSGANPHSLHTVFRLFTLAFNFCC